MVFLNCVALYVDSTRFFLGIRHLQIIREFLLHPIFEHQKKKKTSKTPLKIVDCSFLQTFGSLLMWSIYIFKINISITCSSRLLVINWRSLKYMWNQQVTTMETLVKTKKRAAFFFFLVSSVPSQSPCEQHVCKGSWCISLGYHYVVTWGRTSPAILLWLSQI